MYPLLYVWTRPRAVCGTRGVGRAADLAREIGPCGRDRVCGATAADAVPAGTPVSGIPVRPPGRIGDRDLGGDAARVGRAVLRAMDSVELLGAAQAETRGVGR